MTQRRRSRWSWQLGRLFGIAIRIHATLVALLVFITVAAPIAGAGWRQSIAQALLVIGVFACILVHELAHALVARRFGCRTREILLLPIGGIAQMERIPERPAQELLVAVVGPLTNVVIATLLGGMMLVANLPFAPEQGSLVGTLVVPLFWSNVALAVFNLLPAFPMDGGRVLRAALSFRMDRPRATRIAATLGKVLAAGFAVLAMVIGSVVLALIAVFIWVTASAEAATVSMEASLSHATVADAMVRAAHVVPAATPVERAVDEMLAEGHRELIVAEAGRVTGVVTMRDLAERMAAPEPRGSVAGAMHGDVPIVSPTTPLAAVLEPLEQRGVVLVGDPDVVIGLLTSEQLAAYAALRP